MKKLIVGRIIFISIVFIVCCLFCGCDVSTQAPDKQQPEDKLDYFSDEMLKEWSKENKEHENKYVLNGGYYLHFKGVDYPVVFTEGRITQFDNMPDELFFVEMFELFKDENLEKRCAFRGRYTEYHSFFAPAEEWIGYVLDGKRPKNGTVLYVDETRERRFKVSDDENSGTFGPDDPIPLEGAVSSLKYLASTGKRVPISDKDGILEEFSTVRKLYYKAKELGIQFDKSFSFIPLTCPSFFWYLDDVHNCYFYSNDWTSGETFKEEALQAEKEAAYTYIEIQNISFDSSIEFKVDYCNSKFENEIYLVLMSNEAVRDLEKNIEDTTHYSNVVRDSDGRVVSFFTQYGMRDKYNVFYGSIDEFNDYLLNNTPIDFDSQSGVSYFSSLEGGSYDFREWYLSYNGRVVSDLKATIYAVWDRYKEIALHGDTQESTVTVCKNQVVNALPSPQKGGYEFVGWYASSDFSGEPIEKLTYEDTYTELFAKFDKVDHYTLTFEPYNGEEFDDIIYSYGDTVSLPILKKTYYIFEGWCTDEKCETTPIKEIDETFSGSYHLYPCFKARSFSILVVIDKDTTRKETVAYGEKYTLSIDGVKDGFLGYFDQLGEQYTDECGNALKPFTDGMDIQLFARYHT